MRVYAQDEWLVHEFESLGDFADNLVKYHYVSPTGYASRYLDQARFGWNEELPATLEVVEAVTERLIRDRLIEPAFRPTWDVSGSVVDVGRFVSNEPECMINFPASAVTGKPVISIVTCMSLGGISQEEVLAQGRAVCALVMAIQATGRNVEVWSDNVTGFTKSSSPAKKWSRAHTVKVLVKAANDALDPGQLMFALASYGMGRTLGDSIYPQLDGRIDAVEVPWGKARRRGGADAGNPDPRFYPEGSLILPKPDSLYSQHFPGLIDADDNYDERGWTGNWHVPEEYIQASADFVIEYMRKLGLITES